MATGEHLQVVKMGENALGVVLLGDPKKPEPGHFRVCLPGGDIDISRTKDNDYWVHFRVNRPGDGGDPYRELGQLVDIRTDDVEPAQVEAAGKLLDLLDSVGDLYHLAVKVTTKIPENNDTQPERMRRVRKAHGLPEEINP